MKKYLHAARNDRPYILRPREHSAFYAKLYSGKDLPKVINVSTNKLIPNENCVVRTESAMTSNSRNNKTTVTLKQQKDENTPHWQHVRSHYIFYKFMKRQLRYLGKSILFANNPYWC